MVLKKTLTLESPANSPIVLAMPPKRSTQVKKYNHQENASKITNSTCSIRSW